MFISQISVFLENRAGALLEVTGILNDAGIDLRALSIADTKDYGIARMIVSDTNAAGAALRSSGKAFTVTPVIAVELEDRPGAFHSLLEVLAKAAISIEYSYAFLSPVSGKAEVVLRVEDARRACKVLEDEGFILIGGESGNESFYNT